MTQQRVDLRVDIGIVDALDVVDDLGLEQQQRARAGGGAREPGKKCGSRAATIASITNAGVAVVGVQAVPLPRVVTEHDVGPHRADQRAHTCSRARRVVGELAVDRAEEVDVGGAERGGGGALLASRVATRAARSEPGPTCPSNRR